MMPRKLTKSEKSSGNESAKELLSKKKSNDLGDRPSTSGKQIGLKRSERIKISYDTESIESADSIIYPSTAPETRRSVDVVVVDVHNEIKRSEPSLATRKLFKQRNCGEDKTLENESVTEKNQPSRGRRKEIEQGKAWEIQESIDSIKAFEETNRGYNSADKSDPIIERIVNSPETRSLEKNSGDLNSAERYPQLFGSSEKIVSNAKENSDPENDPEDPRLRQEPKRRRKRWTKTENNLQLTQELIANSSDTNQSVENDSRSSNLERIRPVPAPRIKKGVFRYFPQESDLAFDNGAFRSDAEEVLRIETEVYEPQGLSDGSQDYRQSTKIEMTNFYDTYEKVSRVEVDGSDSEDNFVGSVSSRDNERLNKIKTFEASDVGDSSDELEFEIQRANKIPDSQISYGRRRSKELSAQETSELSEGPEQSKYRSSRTDKSEKRRKKDKLRKKSRESVDLDTGNSLTDLSDLPRSKSRREFSRKSKSKRRKDPRNRENERKHRRKQGAKNESENCEIEYIAEREEKFISITIHKTDVLKTDFTTRHPMVKVHIVDMKTGNYLKIKNEDDDKGRCSYLQPLITGKFDFKDNRSIVPNWEEEIIFEYNFNEIIIPPENKQIFILFEILDLLNFAEASFNYNILGNEGCWHKIAWAFLRPVGVNGELHINKKLRLQLYELPKASKKSGRLSKCEVFNWWRSTNREKYPSTLYVTLKSVDPPIEEPLLYERLSLNKLTEIENESLRSCKKTSDLLQLPKWNRLAAQSCKIPNNHLFDTEIFEKGSFYLTFSNNGKYLACVGSDEANYPIFVYTIPEGKIVAQFIGHSNFVYSLNWSNDDRYLLSASSDQTARIWDMGKKIIQHIEMLPHPAYVYCGKFCPEIKNVVVTGCYDCVARIWTKCKSTKRYELTQELCEHKGYVNSLCFQKDGGLITADSVGVIIIWTLRKKGGGVSAPREWRLSKIIRNNEIESVVINSVVLHPLGSRILVHSRDSGLRIMDLETGVILQRYKGLRNQRFQLRACLSPCGGLVLCGGEDSYLTVWSLESGKSLGRYLIREAKIVACVDYHPFDHILAFSSFGSISSIRVINFEKNSTGENVGLTLTNNHDAVEDSDDIEITMKFDKNDLPGKSNENYAVRKTTSVSRRGERSNPEAQKNYKPRDIKNKSSISRQEILRLRIQRLNESEEGLKSRSAARLNNIIEKIDRILVNTTSNRDLDSTLSSNDTRKKDFVQVLSNSRKDSLNKSRDSMKSRSWRSTSREKGSTSNTDATMEEFIASGESIEMQNINSMNNEKSEYENSSISNRRLSRLKIRAEITENVSSRSDLESEAGERFVYKSSSASRRRSSSKENQFDEASEIHVETIDRKRKTRRREKRRSGSSEEKQLPLNTETCIIDLKNAKASFQSNPSTSDSAGTYTIDKDKCLRPWASDKSKATDTSSSVKSSATFTIENEISSACKSSKKK